jgi:MtrB/PioB family decaheme-associated outer membrane protein
MRLFWKIFLATFLLTPCQLLAANESENPVDEKNWLCNFCTYASGWLGSVDFGTGYSNDPSHKFGNYRGIENEGSFLSLFSTAQYRSEEGTYFDFRARDLGTNNRQIELSGGKEGRYQVDVNYGEIARYSVFGATTPYLGSGTSQLSLPVNWIAGTTTGEMSTLNSSLAESDMRTLRKNLDAGIKVNASKNWHYQAKLSHSEKNGTRPLAGGVLTIHANLFPAPVDFSTDRLDLNVEYSGKHGQVRLGFSSLWFANDQESITWQNPFSPIGNTQQLRAALEPDSKSRHFNLSGNYKFSPGIRLSGKAMIGRIEQNQLFLPYSSNPDFQDLQLPLASLDQQIDAKSLNVSSRLNVRLSRQLNFTARVKIDERDNRTPVIAFTPVITDLAHISDTFNRPYAFERKNYSAEFHYRPGNSFNFRAGVKQQDYQRTLQSVRDTEESGWFTELNFNQWANAQLRLKFESFDRDISSYLQVSHPGLPENPLLRKFNLAGRDRDRLSFELDLAPTQKLNASISFHSSKDRYDQSEIGLIGSREQTANLDIAYSINRNFDIHTFFNNQHFDSQIAGPQFGAAPWLAQSRDSFVTIGVGLNANMAGKLGFTMDYLIADSRGKIHTDSGSGEAPFPEFTTDLGNFRANLNYRLNDHWNWILSAEHESYHSSDWQLDGINNDGISAILTFGSISPNYDASLWRLMASYQF